MQGSDRGSLLSVHGALNFFPRFGVKNKKNNEYFLRKQNIIYL